MANYVVSGSSDGSAGIYIDSGSTYNGKEYYVCSTATVFGQTPVYLFWVNYWSNNWCISPYLGNPYADFQSSVSSDDNPASASWSGVTVAVQDTTPHFTIALSPTSQRVAVGGTGGNLTTTITSVNAYVDAVDLSITTPTVQVVGYPISSGTASASYSYGGYGPGQAIDSDPGTTRWSSYPPGNLPAWWMYQLASPSAVVGYSLGGWAGDGGNGYPTAWTLQASNDNSTWVTLDTQTTQLSSGITYFSVTNSTAYSYYQINITAGTNTYAQLTDIKMYALSSGIVTAIFTPSTVTPASNGNAYSSLALSVSGGATPSTYTFFGQGINSGDSLDKLSSAFTLTVLPYNTTPPTVSSASVNSDGTTLTVNWTVAANPPVLPSTNGSGLYLAGMTYGPVTLSSVNTSGTTTTATLSRPIYIGEVVTLCGTGLNFTDSSSPPNTVANFTGVSITNNSTQPAYAANVDLLCAVIYDNTATSGDVNTAITYLTNKYRINNAGLYNSTEPLSPSYAIRGQIHGGGADTISSGGGNTIIDNLNFDGGIY